MSLSDGVDSCYVTHQTWNGTALITQMPFNDFQSLARQLASKRLIFHNAIFDVNITNSYLGVDLSESVVSDTMILAHLYDENIEYGLKPLAKRYLNIDNDEQIVLKEKMKALNTKDFYKVDLHTMAKYACMDAHMTFQLHEFLLKKLDDAQMEVYTNESIPLLKLVIIPMVRTGVHVDMDSVRLDQININKDIEALEVKIQSEISSYLLPFKQWFYETNYPIKTRGKMASLKKLNPGISDRMVQIQAFKMDGGTYEFNILSKDHLKRLFFDILKETPISTTPTGAPQVDVDFLEHISNKYPFAKSLTIYNKLIKIKSTYIDRFIEESENGIFYPNYFMHRTVSGRLSGDFQQLPRPIEKGEAVIEKYNNKLRSYFIPSPGCIFIDTDYNSLEPRVFASVAGDKSLIDIFANNEDFYSKIAIMVEGIDASPNKDAPNYLGKINKAARQKAKAYSLGIAYGLDDYKLHKDLDIPQERAKALVSGYLNAFPQLAQWMKNTRESVLSTGQVRTRFGRIRHAPEVVEMHKKHGPQILNALELWKKYMDGDEPLKIEYAKAKVDYKTVRHAVNNAYNFQIQGLSAHIINRASIKIAERFKSENVNAVIIAQIHDELLINCIMADKDRAALIIQDCLENTTKIEVPLTAEPSFGMNFLEAKG